MDLGPRKNNFPPSETMHSSVSVVIPAYNTSRFIRETLGSVFAQTRLPAEVIVVDDASTDGTSAIVEAMAAAAPSPLRLIRLPKNTGGPAIPLNVGIEAAKCDLIALLDHDDLMLPHRIAAGIDAMQQHPEIEMAMGNYETFTSQGFPPRIGDRTISGEWRELLTPGPGVVHRVDAHDFLFAFFSVDGLQGGCSNMFFRKCLWARAGGFDAVMGATSDHDFILRAIDRPVAWIDQKLFRRRLHDSNLSYSPKKFIPLVYTRHIQALLREFAHSTSTSRRGRIKSSIRNNLLELAYEYRKARAYCMSVKTYLEYWAWGGDFWCGLKCMAKVPICCLRDLFTGGHALTQSKSTSTEAE
jgi:glycosyltransferase involved in cell wall biosynthesis